MANFTNKTQNYGLPQYGSTDSKLLLGSMTNAFKTIDDELAKASDKTAFKDITSLFIFDTTVSTTTDKGGIKCYSDGKCVIVYGGRVNIQFTARNQDEFQTIMVAPKGYLPPRGMHAEFGVYQLYDQSNNESKIYANMVTLYFEAESNGNIGVYSPIMPSSLTQCYFNFTYPIVG